jgi:toxin HigB-1
VRSAYDGARVRDGNGVRFRDKRLRRLFEKDDRRGLNPSHVEAIRDILSALAAATSPGDLDLPGFALHPLKGKLKGYWAVSVNANWRIVFRFEGTEATDVDYLDYH